MKGVLLIKMKKVFRTDVRVIFRDTDAMGVVYHTNYIHWFEVGRTELLRDIGFPYSELEKIPIWMPVAQVYCEYKSPARYDDLLEVATYISKLGKVSLTLSYEITRKSTGELLVTGYTRHGVTDESMKPLHMGRHSPEFFATLQAIADEE